MLIALLLDHVLDGDQALRAAEAAITAAEANHDEAALSHVYADYDHVVVTARLTVRNNYCKG